MKIKNKMKNICENISLIFHESHFNPSQSADWSYTLQLKYLEEFSSQLVEIDKFFKSFLKKEI